MPDDRRSFIKKFGMTLGALIASGTLPGCGPKQGGGLSNTRSRIKKGNGSSATPRAAQWGQLHQCWLCLDTIDEDIRKATRAYRDGIRTRAEAETFLAIEKAIPEERVARHQALLDALVARGQLEEPVARHMQTAFEEAIYHVVRSMATCYMGLPIEHWPRENLLQQAMTLREISGDLDPATVARAQVAIAQDIAFLEIFRAGAANRWSLAPDYKAGVLKASPDEMEAARLLTELFLERTD